MHVLLALVVALLWSISPIVHKSILSAGISRETVLVLTGLLYFPCILAYGLIYHKRIITDIPKITKTQWALLICLTVMSGLIGNILYFWLLKHNDSYVVTALAFCSPIFTLVLAYWLLHEKITPVSVIGVLLIVLGVGCISLNTFWKDNSKK